jgi:predicted PurR-regulated permease PerM
MQQVIDPARIAPRPAADPQALQQAPDAIDREGVSVGIQRYARLGLVLLLIGLGLWTIRSFLPALVWASILAIAIWPFYQRVHARWSAARHDVVLPVLFTLGVAILFGLPFILLVLQAGREARDLLGLFHQASTSGVPVPQFLSHLPFGADQATEWWRDNLAVPLPTAEILRRVDHSSMLMLTRQFGFEVAHRSVIFFFMLMTFFFLLRNGETLVVDLLAASAKLFGARGERIARQMVSSIHGTARAC